VGWMLERSGWTGGAIRTCGQVGVQTIPGSILGAMPGSGVRIKILQVRSLFIQFTLLST